MVAHEYWVGEGSPINSVTGEVIGIGVVGKVESPWSVSGHAKHEHLPRAGCASAACMKSMGVPGFCPLEGVLIDGSEEEVVQQPYVLRAVSVETARLLELQEESLPLAAEAAGDVKPKALNTRVVHAPGRKVMREHQEKGTQA